MKIIDLKLGKKVTYLLIIQLLLILFTSCNLIGGHHYHDGEYAGEMGFFEVRIEINGDEIIVNHSIAGTSKLECKQFKDYIEVVEPGGVKKIIKVLENGDLEYSNWLVLEKIKSDKTTDEDVESEDIKVESLDNKKQVRKTKEVRNEKNNYKESEIEIINPKSIIRNPEKGQEIRKIVDAKDENYNFNYNDERRDIRIISKSDNTEYVYDPEYESVEAYIYYSFKSIAEIKDKLESFGVEFYDNYDNIHFNGGIEEYGSSCRQILLEKLSDRVKISYSFECD